ncbi:MAG: TetR/AcrR family transcriptional regulator [Ignavibacteria bacterium]|jgi:AcrR family transcriptional regulator|nr:TetR/AcrR family transcriptional regulator [Ignavibacteria bacterium]MCU7517004.1 TetR/AcrR family transcriptional regulator [Ignavibacteria bacterium]
MNDSRKYILKIAFQLFMQKSYKEVTLKEIVEKTKLSKGAFYHYFPSKEQLFMEVIDSYYYAYLNVDYLKFSQDNLKDFYNGILEQMQAEINKMSTEFQVDDKVVPMNYYLLIFDAINLLPGFRKRVIEISDREFEQWRKIVSTARAKGEISSPMTDELIAKTFIRINDGAGIYFILEGNVEKMNFEIKELWDAFYNHIKT